MFGNFPVHGGIDTFYEIFTIVMSLFTSLSFLNFFETFEKDFVLVWEHDVQGGQSFPIHTMPDSKSSGIKRKTMQQE